MTKTERYRKKVYRLGLYLAVTVFLTLTLFPFLWVLVGSLHTTADLLRARVFLIPANPTFEHYRALFEAQHGVKLFFHYIVNSLRVGSSVAVLTMTTAAFGAYGLSRYRFRGKEGLSRLMLFVYVFPTSLLLLPLYVLLARFGLVDAHTGLILVHTGLASPFCTWLLRSFFEAIPREIEESAAIDGASWGQVLFHILLPLASPALVTAGVYALVVSWGEYTFSANLLMSGAKWTVPVGLATYMTEQAIEWGQLLAGTVLTAVPILLIFFPFARFFLRGFLEGALR